MNSPNEIGTLVIAPAGHHSVGADSHILPGAVILVVPSSRSTKISIKVERTPKRDAKERTRSGMNDVGMMTSKPKYLYVLDE